jgi:hypothetical protein
VFCGGNRMGVTRAEGEPSDVAAVWQADLAVGFRWCHGVVGNAGMVLCDGFGEHQTGA